MKELTSKERKYYDDLFEERKKNILEAKDEITVKGTSYYVSNDGDDANDGKTPGTSWKTLDKVSNAYLYPGDGVFFKRGDLFRGTVITKPGVTYAAYGEGKKPTFYGCHKSLADPALWEIYDEEKNIWKCTEKMLDPGTIVFNHGEFHSRKLIPSYINMQFVCRDDESKPFVIADEMTEDLDVYWYFENLLTKHPTKGQDFPVPDLRYGPCNGEIYLRCDRGNPGDVFESVESVDRHAVFCVRNNSNVTIDNMCIKYACFGISAGTQSGLHVTNCEIGWIGGNIQNYLAIDPNFPQGTRGSVTRFGNAVEIYGGCDDYLVQNNYIYQVYDAAASHQVNTRIKKTMTNIRYSGNVIDNCVYGIEYFLDILPGGEESYMDNLVMNGNFLRNSGYGWGQQRHNKHTPALIKGWSYVNTARNYSIYDNIFDRCAYQMLHVVSQKEESKPKLYDNTYIQHLGGMIGRIGANEIKEPDIEIFDENAEEKINNIFGDKTAKVFYIK